MPPVKSTIDPRKGFVPRWIPWIIAAVMLAVYLLTLNRWVNLLNMTSVSMIAGWNWRPDEYNPLMMVLTYPLRWLPIAWVPVGLNVFSAVCGALTLALLARSVAILPHDRTEAGRTLEKSDFGFLTTRTAWLPPVLAALVCGLHLSFWVHSTSFTWEIPQLLLFAFLIWQILEFRLDENDYRLYLACVVYGLGLADDWALAGYFPCFLLALVWSKGVEFFHPVFLLRSAFCALGGALLFLLLPILNTYNYPDTHISFWKHLHENLRLDWVVLKSVSNSEMRYALGVMSLTSLLPVFLLAIRWPESFGDASRIGMTVSRWMFHLVHLLVFSVCLWVMFDPPFSPRNLSAVNTPGLTFYYLTAMCVGYYCGYLLLVFGRWGGVVRDNLNPIRSKSQWNLQHPAIRATVRKGSIAVIFTVALIAVAELAYLNLPVVQGNDGELFHQYAREVTRCLPPQGGILMGDSDSAEQNQPWRVLMVQTELACQGRLTNYIPVSTVALPWPAYQRYLHKKYPGSWPACTNTNDSTALTIGDLIKVVKGLYQTNKVYYLNASFGYYFEQFYEEPHGLAYQLKLLPEDTLVPPLPAAGLMAENEKYWQSMDAGGFNGVTRNLDKQRKRFVFPPAEAVAHLLHASPTPEFTSYLIGNTYSQALNFWGVTLQQSGDLDHAARRFTNAITLNPDNLVAQANLDFNHRLQAGEKPSGELTRVSPEDFSKYRSWNEILNINGPSDDPNYCYNIFSFYMNGTLAREAVAPISRVQELMPDELVPRILLARLYVLNKLPDRALAALREPLTHPERFNQISNYITHVNLLGAAAYFQKNDLAHAAELTEKQIQLYPEDQNLARQVAHAYLSHGMYSNNLVLVDRELAAMPGDPYWLMGRGITLFKLGAYRRAVEDYTQILATQTNNSEIIFDRGLANLYGANYAGARADFLRLQQNATNAYELAYGLTEVAVHQHDTNEVIRNCKLYLANAPTNTDEYLFVRKRLSEWHGK